MPEAPSYERLLAVVGEFSAGHDEQAALIVEQAAVIEGLRVQVPLSPGTVGEDDRTGTGSVRIAAFA